MKLDKDENDILSASKSRAAPSHLLAEKGRAGSRRSRALAVSPVFFASRCKTFFKTGNILCMRMSDLIDIQSIFFLNMRNDCLTDFGGS